MDKDLTTLTVLLEYERNRENDGQAERWIKPHYVDRST